LAILKTFQLLKLMKKSDLIFNVIIVPLDFFFIVLGGVVAYFIRTSPWLADWRPAMFVGNLPIFEYFIIVLVVGIFWTIIFAVLGLYRVDFRKIGAREIFRIFIATSAGLLSIVVYIFLRREWFDSRFLILVGWILATLFVLSNRFVFRKIFKLFLRKLKFAFPKVLVIGNSTIGENLISEIKKKPALYSYSSIVHFPSFDFEKIEETVFSSGNQVGEIILADFSIPRTDILKLVDLCEENQIGFKFVPDLFQTFFSNIEISTFGGEPLIEIKRTPLDGWGRVIKRIVDVFGSLFGLVIFSPLWLVVAATIKIDSRGPIFVGLKRVGRGKEFNLYKFRSMVKGAQALKPSLLKFNEREDGPLFKMKNDPRITKVGRFLRKSRIDEMPQLINVFLGQMSLVGPRPHEPQEVAKYQKHHKRTFFVKPGMTGIAQVSGSSDLKFEEEVKLDSYYIKNWSLLLDFKVIIRTVFKVFTDKTAA